MFVIFYFGIFSQNLALEKYFDNTDIIHFNTQMPSFDIREKPASFSAEFIFFRSDNKTFPSINQPTVSQNWKNVHISLLNYAKSIFQNLSKQFEKRLIFETKAPISKTQQCHMVQLPFPNLYCLSPAICINQQQNGMVTQKRVFLGTKNQGKHGFFKRQLEQRISSFQANFGLSE